MKMSGAEGFTVVEMVVSVVVASLFALSLITLFTTFNYFTANARQLSVADGWAYNQLQQYTSPDTPSSDWFTCSSATDRSVNPSANLQIRGGNVNPSSVDLPSPITYTVKTYAPFGCADPDQTEPVMVSVAITYGKTARVVTHSGYALWQQ